MDSVTQFALGAVVGTAVLGKRWGVRRAAIAGGLLGTVPDLDVYLTYDDPVEAFIGHRGASHSLIVHAVAAPVIGEIIWRLKGAAEVGRQRFYLAVYLCLTTHALLDAMTVYGTQLFWPIWPEPLGLGSIFIIDPLYTVPLLIVTLWAFCRRDWTPRIGRAVKFALALSSLYLVWTAVAQQIVEARGDAYLQARDIQPGAIAAGPTPLNSLFWRLIAVDESQYFHVYVPLLGNSEAITAYEHPRWAKGISCWAAAADRGVGLAGTLAEFADGFYQIELEDEAVVYSDLRMGLYPNFVFKFVVAEHRQGQVTVTSPRRIRGNRSLPGDLEWLLAGVLGERAVRPAEDAALLDDGAKRLAQDAGNEKRAC